MTGERELRAAAARLVECLARDGLELVLAESCTGGLAAAMLAGVPGVSARLCGSAVVYQTPTKSAWLGVSRKLLDQFGPVSPQAATAMAIGVLKKTRRAQIAGAITGHLGPDAPAGQDGLVYLAIARRALGLEPSTIVKRLLLGGEPARTTGQKLHLRHQRQQAAALALLKFLLREVRSDTAPRT